MAAPAWRPVSHGVDIPALRLALSPPFGKGRGPIQGAWSLYSVGPNFQDDGGVTFSRTSTLTQPLDIVFEIPPVEGGDGAGKGKDASKDSPAPAGLTPSPRPGS